MIWNLSFNSWLIQLIRLIQRKTSNMPFVGLYLYYLYCQRNCLCLCYTRQTKPAFRFIMLRILLCEVKVTSLFSDWFLTIYDSGNLRYCDCHIFAFEFALSGIIPWLTRVVLIVWKLNNVINIRMCKKREYRSVVFYLCQ